ncbi:MAG: protein kinase [Muribaculaceae bacterium]|nr:protein kinase [Muribaculaceae bacterium]
MLSLGLRQGSILRNDTYRIERILGQGGFGITYLATDLSLERFVAVKEFFPKDYCERESTTSHITIGTSSNVDLVSRLKAKFLKEARNIAKLDHPGIIKIHTAFEENNTAYYVMDYIEGRNLSEMVKQTGPLSESKAIQYISKVGDALDYIHKQNINHLDIKPANIMIRKSDDRPVLIDFGLSKQYDAKGNQTSTTPTGISHGFAPLEQYKVGGVSEFSPQTDVYSLAATLYYIISGTIPPHATDLVEENIKFPSGFPVSIRPAITKAMSSSRKNRHAGVSQFVKSLKVKTDKENTQVIHPQPVPQPQPEIENKNLSKIFLAIGVVVAIALIIIFVNRTTSDSGSPSNEGDFVAIESEIEPQKANSVTGAKIQTTKIEITIDNNTMCATLAENEATKALIEKLSSGPITITMDNYGRFEKVGALPWSLPASDTRVTAKPGDIVLYTSNYIEIFYGTDTWSYTPLGVLDSTISSEISAFVGSGAKKVTLSLVESAGM